MRTLLVTALVASACGSKSPPAEEQPESVARTPEPEPEPQLDSKSEPAPKPEAEPKPDPAFALVARRGETFVASAMRLQGAAAGSTFLLSGNQVFVLRSDGGIDHEAKWVRGIELSDPTVDDTANVAWWEPRAIEGTWPNVRLVLVPNGDEIEPPDLFSYNADHWSKHVLGHDGSAMYVHDLAPWLEGSMLMLVSAERDPDAKGTRFMKTSATADAPSEPGAPVLAFDASTDGEVIAIVEHDGRQEIWTQRVPSAGTRTPLPGAATVEQPRVVTTGLPHAWVFGGRDDGSAYLARREDTTWKEVAVECDGPIPSLSVATDGSVYVVCPKGDASTLLRRVGEAAWTPVPNAPSKPHTVVARSTEDIWVLAGDDTDPTELWHTGTSVETPIELPDAADGVRAGLEWADAHPVTKDCARVWVPIVGSLAADAVETKLEPIYDDLFPQVRTTRITGQEQLGIMLPNASDPPGAAARAKKITDALGADAGEPSCNERPQLPGE